LSVCVNYPCDGLAICPDAGIGSSIPVMHSLDTQLGQIVLMNDG